MTKARNADRPKLDWQDVDVSKCAKSVQDLDAAYRAASKKAGEARDKLAEELKSRIRKHRENDIAEDPSLEVILTFNFGRIAYALAPREEKKGSGGKKALVLA